MKVVILVIVCALTLYSPLELTNLIFKYGPFDGRVFELVFIWVTYIVAVSILIKVVKR